jgi:hypothetical protein
MDWILETQGQEFIRSWDSVKKFAFDTSEEDSDAILFYNIHSQSVEPYRDHDSLNKRFA